MVHIRRKATLVAVLGVSALVLASAGVASAQQSEEARRLYELAMQQQLQRQQHQAQEMQRALALRQEFEAQQQQVQQMQQALAAAQEMRVRPLARYGSLFAFRSGGIASLALANAGDLELSDSQEGTIRDAQRAHRREEIRRDADIEIAELELEEMMEADTLDLDAIEAHMRQIADLQVDERMAGLRLDRTVRDVLTAEQVEKLEEMSPERLVIETLRRRNR